MQEVALPKATASNAQRPAFFQIFLLQHREDSRPNYSLLVIKREEDPGGINVEPKTMAGRLVSGDDGRKDHVRRGPL